MNNFTSLAKFLSTSAAIFGLLLASTCYADTAIFINELHYDNNGTDAGEAIEIAGPAGTDLNGWSIVLYNGSNGLVYNTTNLSGVLADAGDGFGYITQNYPVNGIQNGSPDGIALVDHFNNVVQFISYEGSLTAVDGPAVGLSSSDIGVSEVSSTVAGFSLQLSGSGVSSGDFSWGSAAPATFGSINNGQTFGSVVGPNTSILINELNADNLGTDGAEFIELYDGGAGNVSLDGLVVVLYNGSDDASYSAINLTGFSTNTEGYFVLCSNVATVAGCDLDLAPDTNLIQNGADAVALYIGDASEFPNDTPITITNLIDAVVYGTNDADDAALLGLLNAGQPQINDTRNESLQRCPDGSGGKRNTVNFASYLPTPGVENICVAPAELKYIHEIQGIAASSPLQGKSVIIEAVVVGDFQDSSELDGFYLQEENVDIDADDETSEGIFVYAPGSIDVQSGDVVRVTGDVTEFFNLTEITNVISIEIIGQDNSLLPTVISFPLLSDIYLERYEGMLITTAQAMVISEYFNYDRFGEVVLSLPLAADLRQFQPTAVVTPGVEANARQQENILRRIILDDGSSRSNPAVLRHPNGLAFSLDNRFRGGDMVADVVGVMDYRFGMYRIQPTNAANHVVNNPRSDFPGEVYGDIKVASFNVLNYFTTLDTGENICGPEKNMGCRGADNAEEFIRQKEKIVDALTRINADIVGLIELENNAATSIADLVGALNAQVGTNLYGYIDTGAIGTDAIKVGIIYQLAKVKPVGPFKVLDASVDSRYIDDKNRPALAQSFVSLVSAARFTVAVNHLKSKGSACTNLADPDIGDGQGNCNKTRENAALAEVEWLATDPTGADDPDVLIIGDLNAYAQEDPIKAIESGVDGLPGTDDDYTNLIAMSQGDSAYSYVFNGQYGYLDYALANSTLAPQVTGITEWHINADEPDVLDYNTDFKPAEQIALYEANSFRSSDHDPVIVGLDLTASIGDIIKFIEDAIADGSLQVKGPEADKKLEILKKILINTAHKKLEKLKQNLIKAAHFKSKANNYSSCEMLRVAQQEFDGNTLRNFLEGDSAIILSRMITNYRKNACTLMKVTDK